VLVFIVLVFGGPFERMSHRRLAAVFDRPEQGGAASGAESSDGSQSRNSQQ
jgi:hypothetical protein